MTDLDRLRTIRQGGKTRGKVNVKKLEDRGKTTGFQIEYHDGRVEGVVRPDAVKYRLSLKEE